MPLHMHLHAPISFDALNISLSIPKATRTVSFGVQYIKCQSANLEFLLKKWVCTLTWSSEFHTQRTRDPTARHNIEKQLAHSPHLPFFVCNNAQTSPYRGNRTKIPQTHLYSSVLEAPLAASSSVGGVIPWGMVLFLQTGHSGLLIHSKKSRLNHLFSGQITIVNDLLLI